MQVRTNGKTTTAPITDTFELTELVQRLADFIAFGADPDSARYLARKAMATSEHAAWRIREQSRRIAELEQASLTDQLTGLLNRAGFEMELRRTLSESKRHEENGALIYIDLDEFKQTNDTFGHCAGDAVLKKAGSILQSNVRDSDRVARLGGDEFIVLMPRTKLEAAENRATVLEWALNHAAIDWQGEAVPIRASLGTECFGAGDEEVSIVARADQAMYHTKRTRAESTLTISHISPPRLVTPCQDNSPQR